MNNVNLTGLNTQQNLSPELKKKFETQENFTAIDKEQLKQDSVELANKAKDNAKENFIFKTMRNLGVEDPKKFIKSVGLTILTVVGVAFIGNKTAGKTIDLGINIDKFLLEGNNFISKGYRAIAGFLGSGKNRLTNAIKNSKSKTVQDLSETFKNRVAKPIQKFAQTYGSGGKGIFSMTPPDVLRTGLNESSGLNKITKEITKTLNENGIRGKKAANKVISTFLTEGETRALEVLNEFTKDDNISKKLIGELTQSNSKIQDRLKALFGNSSDEIFESLFKGGDYNHIDLSEKISKSIRKAHNLKTEEEVKAFLVKEFEKGGSFEDLSSVLMNKGGVMSSWWPVNLLEKIGRKITGKQDLTFARGNLGNAILKRDAISGDMARTPFGKLVQFLPIFSSEYITNFVNDKSGFGVFLCGNLIGLYNNAQEAPKGKKVPTVTNDFGSTIGSVAVTTPIAAGITYGLATLKNLEGKSIISKGLKGLGKVFGLGLDKYVKDGNILKQIPTTNKIARFAGGALRLAMIMFVVSPIVSKPVTKVINKIFGKPYNKAEEEMNAKQQAAAEAEAKKIIPELGITQGEFIQKIQSNPKAVEELQKNPELVQKLQQNPKLLVDYLDGKDITKVDAQAVSSNNNSKKVVSPLNENIINSRKQNVQNQVPQTTLSNSNNSQGVAQARPKSVDTATYVPSSAFVAKDSASTLSQDKVAEYNQAMSKADKALAKAEKYI